MLHPSTPTREVEFIKHELDLVSMYGNRKGELNWGESLVIRTIAGLLRSTRRSVSVRCHGDMREERLENGAKAAIGGDGLPWARFLAFVFTDGFAMSKRNS